ncbi:MAG: ATP-dependent DNA helicase RecG [Planctomycetes bacterium]|nr:ATP-dependent DNA helicase RecG [Planctomycetota bacterium]
MQYVKGVGPKLAQTLKKLDIRTVADLFYHLPRGYQDRSQIVPIEKVKLDTFHTVRGKVKLTRQYRTRRRVPVFEAILTDGTGELLLKFFGHRTGIEEHFKEGTEIIASGKVTLYHRAQMVSPHYERPEEMEEDDHVHTNRIVPIYPLTQGIGEARIRRIVKGALDEYLDAVEDFYNESFRTERRLMSLTHALRAVHYPESRQEALSAQRRLKYDEFLLFEIGMALRRRGLKEGQKGISFEVTSTIDEHIRARFPFDLTQSQEKVIQEIQADMQDASPMNRLLQGDVGSGKTVVALYAILVAIANKKQAAIMAPTEILAEQHYQTIMRYLRNSRVRIALLAGGLTQKMRRETLEKIAAGEVDLLVGTHALVEGDVEFKDLGMVVVDEQHKFGVLQRQKLRRKGVSPDVLVMTATPIPRTLSLTVFGDLDVSTIEELPPGRQPVMTRWVNKTQLRKAYNFIRTKLQDGQQAFIVYPLVEESEKLDLKAATEGARFLQKEVFPNFRVGLLHGRMKPGEKDQVMRRFRDGGYHVLVSTIVIEVGIDIPNASVMVVEHAERFGLAQLHQLRGRIGRGEHKSYCLLFGEPKSETAERRLRVMTQTSNGFKIAEEDLRIRGPGEFFGTRQHGLPEFKVGDIIEDFELLRLARKDAFALVETDPTLSAPQHQGILQQVRIKFRDRLDLIDVG